MNCKQGDLAIIVKSWAGNEGKIVQCVRLHKDMLILTIHGSIRADTWEIDRMMPDIKGFQGNFILDACLRPIRDNPCADETLTWLPVPEKETA